MKKYKLVQEYEIMEDDLTSIKDMSAHIVIGAKDIEEDRIINMLSRFSNELANLMLEESSEIEKGFAALNEKLMSESDRKGKRWFK